MRQLSEGPPSRLYAHWFAVLWRSLALIAFVLAAVLTAHVVRVRDETPIMQFVGAYGDYRGDAVATLYLSHDVMTMTAPPQTKYILLPGSGPCWLVQENEIRTGMTGTQVASVGKDGDGIIAESEAGPSPPPKNWIRPVKSAKASSYAGFILADVSGSWASGMTVDGPKSIACSLANVPPARLTYTKYALLLAYDREDAPNDPLMFFGWNWSGKRPIETLRVVPDIPHADAVAMIGAVATGAYADLHPLDRLRIEYNDTVNESRRDILFVVIGALIALGAAMMLESLRPIVEMYAERTADQARRR